MDVIYTTFEKTMSKNERKQLDQEIKYYETLNQQQQIDQLFEAQARTWKIFHHRRRVIHNGKLFKLTEHTTPETLVYIDRQHYNIAYPFNVITYGLFPVETPNDNEVAGMRLSSTLNCVAEQAIKHFIGTRRGNGLNEARAAKIAAWNESIKKKGTGATKKDVAALEKKLKVPIIVKIFPDRTFYSSGCYRKAGTPIEIIDHNFHAWGVAEGNFPDNKTVQYYHSDMFDWIHANSSTEPVNVWLFSSDGDKYDQFVKSSGEIYQTEALQRSMIDFANKYINGKTPEDAKLLVDKITQTSFTSSIAAQFAREKNSWKPTKSKFLEDVRASCIEYGHGGLWNTEYDLDDMMSVDMIACYPGSFLGGGECHVYFTRFGLPTHRMTRRAVNGPLPNFDVTGFAKVASFKIADRFHAVVYLWVGKHLSKRRWVPIPLLRFMLDHGILTELTISELIMCYDKQTDVWLPTPDKFPRYEIEFLRDVITSECKNLGRIIIEKFTQGDRDSYEEDGRRKRKSAKLVLDDGDLKFVIDDAVSKGVFVKQTAACLSSGEPFGTIVEYFSGEMPQYVHLRSFMLAYVTINLLTMANRFPDIAVRVATDSFYYDKKYHDRVKEYLGNGSTWGTWRVKHEELHMYRESADVPDRPEYYNGNIVKLSTSPSIHDPVARHKLVYLNGPGGCGKTTRVIELFGKSDLIALTPTHRLVRDFKSKGIKACTYHSFLGGTEMINGPKIAWVPRLFLM